MSGWTTDVLIYFFIVGLRLPRHDGLAFTLFTNYSNTVELLLVWSEVHSNFGDSSWPLFSMYTKAAEDEDNKMAGRWQKDADGILIFVSLRVGIHLSFTTFPKTL